MHRNAKLNSPDDHENILSHFRNFRSSMLMFQNTARVVRGLNEGDKDVDIMQSILEGLIEHVDALRQTQEETTENLNNIIAMI